MIATAVVLSCASLGAGAQQTAPPVVAKSYSAADAATILGRDVIDSRNDDVGPLVDLLVDNGGRPIAGIVDVGGFLGVGTRRVAIAWRLLRVVHDDDGVHIVMDMAFDAAAGAAEYQGPDRTMIVIDRMPD
jgi:hypothetical protein